MLTIETNQIKLAGHYTNIQPLTVQDNLSKGAMWNGKILWVPLEL